MNTSQNIINIGNYIIIQRQKYIKLHKFGSSTSCATLGNEQIELCNIENCKYFTTFKLITKSEGKQRKFSLEVCDGCDMFDELSSYSSGNDNRNIIDDGKSQNLSTEEILTLRDNTANSKTILENLINNSSTFHSKTEYSQEKYIRKKQKKFFEYICIKKPTIRMISDIMYRQDPSKILGIRPDVLSQILSYSNINESGNYLLYDSGCNGLLSSAILNAIGANTKGKLIYAHPGMTSQKQALLAMNYPFEQLSRCISVNIYSVLRHFYQNKEISECDAYSKSEENCVKNVRKRKLSNSEDDILQDKKKKEESSENDVQNNTERVPIWVIENEKASLIMSSSKVDSLIIASKEHPLSIFKALLPFVNIGRPFVLFNQFKEPIQECYTALKKMPNITCLKMLSSWSRDYQVMKDRTHPDVLMQGNSGYLLCGWIVQ